MNLEKTRAWLAIILGGGLILLLMAIVAIDATVSILEKTRLDPEISALLSQALTGIIGVVAGYLAGKKE
jgi:uncharacterized membrane protein